jgi:hypothetical protein
MGAEDVRDLKTRPPFPMWGRAQPVRHHRRLPEYLAFLRADEVQWALGTADVSLRHLGVAGRGLKRRVTKQLLDDANVLAHLEEVRGEAVAQGMSCDALGEVALDYGLV